MRDLVGMKAEGEHSNMVKVNAVRLTQPMYLVYNSYYTIVWLACLDISGCLVSC